MASLVDAFEKLNTSDAKSYDAESYDAESYDGTSMNNMFNPKRAVFTFGRFQPPTKGHEGLIRSIEEKSEEL